MIHLTKSNIIYYNLGFYKEHAEVRGICFDYFNMNFIWLGIPDTETNPYAEMQYGKSYDIL